MKLYKLIGPCIVLLLPVAMFLCLTSKQANGQITLSNNTVSLNAISDNFGYQPWFPDISVTGTGTLSKGACSGDAVLCGMLNAAFSPSTTAPSTLTLYFSEFSFLGVTNGTYTADQTITGSSGCAANCVVHITLVLAPRSTLYQPTVTSPAGSFVNCNTGGGGTRTTYRQWAFWTNSDGTFDNCPWSPDQVPGGTFEPPGATITYPDGNFGAVVFQLTNAAFGFAADFVAQDSAATAWNAASDSTRFASGQGDGTRHIWKRTGNTAAIEFGNGPGSLPPFGIFDPLDKDVYYYTTGVDNFIHKVTLGAPPNGWVDNAAFYTYPGTGPIKFGGNMAMSKDGWLAFLTVDSISTDNKIGLLNTRSPATAFLTASFPNDLYSPKAISLSPGVDTSTGCRYILKNDVPQDPPAHIEGMEFLKFCSGDTAITHWAYHPRKSQFAFSGPFPGLGGACDGAAYKRSECTSGSHYSMVEVGGRQFFSEIVPNSSMPTSHALLLIAAGDKMNVPVETDAAGGQYATFSLSAQISDTHHSAATNAPVVVVSLDSDVGTGPSAGPTGPIVWWITGATTASPIHVTISQSCGDGTDARCPAGYNGSNGDVILVSGIWGITGFTGQVGHHGLCTIANLAMDKKSFDCAATIGVGTYTALSGEITANAKPASIAYQNQNLVFTYPSDFFTSHTYTVRRVNVGRSPGYASRYSSQSYNDQLHTNMSQDGQYMYWETNMGYPGEIVLMMAATGYVPPPLVTGSVLGGKVVMSGKMVIH